MWAGLLVVTVSTTVAGLAVVVTAVTLLAAPTSWRAARRAAAEPAGLTDRALLGGLVLVGLCPVAAAADPWVGVVALGAGAAVVGVRGGPSHRPVLAAALPGLAGLGLVALAGEGGQAALVLVLAVCLFDAANALMGTSESGGVLGAVAGILTVAVLAVAVQAVLVPPFTAAGVWILFAVVALGAPAGVVLCRRVAPGRVPALRRLDSLVLVAPVWAVASLALVHH